MLGHQALCRLHPDEAKQVRTQIREKVKAEFPGKVRETESRYGLEPAFGPSRHTVGRAVILVHGMDDPGKVWMYLQPRLADNGFRVWILSYPNDQPIFESARFFFEQMQSVRKRGEATVSIVAHSMGGLVAREMLTQPGLSYPAAVAEGRVPEVDRLIMVGTPNHGSEMAHFRIFGEFRDQLANLLKGDYAWIEGFVDGAGEAGVDMLPGSPFLDALNSRPHPGSLNMAVIAGVMDASAEDDIRRFVAGMTERLPGNMHDAAAAVGDFLTAMVRGLGDGLVSVDSATLDGYPLHIVQGSHLSIIRNFRESAERVPPAVPVILEYLEKARP